MAIDGPSGSGKTTFAARLAGPGVTIVSTDDFATWTDPVSWWPRLVEGVLTPLAHGRPGRYRRMDWSSGTPRLGDWVDVPVPDVLIVEGVSAARASVRPHLTALVWLEEPDPAIRLANAVARDGEPARAELAAWQRFEAGWFAVDRTGEAADLRVTVGW